MTANNTSAAKKRSTTPVPNKERTEITIERLKSAAFELIAEGGISALTTAALAKRSGYSTAIVSYHFGSKDNFIQFLLDDAYQRNSVVSAIPLETVDTIAELKNMLARYAKFVREQPEAAFAYLALVSSANETNPRLLKAAQKMNHLVRKSIEQAIVAGQKGGSINKQIDASSSAIAIVGGVRGIIMQFMVDREINLEAAFYSLLKGIEG